MRDHDPAPLSPRAVLREALAAVAASLAIVATATGVVAFLFWLHLGAPI